MKAESSGLAGWCLSSNHGVRLSDGATFIAIPFQTFIGNLRPEFFQLRGCRLVGVPFGIIGSPGHLDGSSFSAQEENGSCHPRFRRLFPLQPPIAARQLKAHIVVIALVISTIRSGEGHLNEHDADSRFSRGNGPLPKSHPNLGRS